MVMWKVTIMLMSIAPAQKMIKCMNASFENGIAVDIALPHF